MSARMKLAGLITALVLAAGSALAQTPNIAGPMVPNSAGGSGGTPGGSSLTLQYNNAGSFGGLTGSSVSGSNLTLGGILTLGSNALILNGTSIVSSAANITDFRNGTNAQTLNVYNTFTDASNYERGFIKWASNQLQIGADAAGTGSARLVVVGSNPSGNATSNLALQGAAIRFFVSGGLEPWNMSTAGHFVAPTDNLYDIGASGASRPRNVYVAGQGTFGTSVKTTATVVGSLVAAATAGAGARSFVTDATACTFNTTVTGGGSTACPVTSDGTNWKGG